MQNIEYVYFYLCVLLMLMLLLILEGIRYTDIIHMIQSDDDMASRKPPKRSRDSLSRVFRPSNSQIPIPQNARSLDFQLHEYLNHLNPEGDSLSHAECAAAFHIIAQGAAPHRKSVLPEWGWAICPLEQHLWCWWTVLKA